MTAAITDFGQFSGLRAGADSRDPALLREVAGQFEALFVQTLFKNMRDTSLAEPIFGQSDQHDMYQDMLDKQFALEISSGRGIGLADMLVRQLGGEDVPSGTPAGPLTVAADRYTGEPANLAGVIGVDVFVRTPPPQRSGPVPPGGDAAVATKSRGSAGAGEVGTVPDWSSPADFARQVWPYAQRAASRLNVSPKALVAQAALETGWGRHVMARADGTSSFNLFGIKASHDWTGGTVSKPTFEFRDGIMQKERATFRAYPDLAATFDDYAEFIGEHPRYREVTNRGDDTAGFAAALQESGYATDPRYADKINAILDSDIMRQALQWLKINIATPITDGYPGDDAMDSNNDDGGS